MLKVRLILACCAVVIAAPASALADTETNPIYLTVAQAGASNGIQAVIHNLPSVETLWPEHPETYLQTAKEAAQALARAKRTAATKHALLSLWTNVLQKPLPTNGQHALACIALKQEMVMPLMSVGYIRGDKSRWVDIARFVGQVRDRIIPNYRLQGGLVSYPAYTPEQELILQKALEAIKKGNAADHEQAEFQLSAHQAEFHLLHFAPQQFLKDPQFIKAVSSAAHLSDEEVKILKGLD